MTPWAMFCRLRLAHPTESILRVCDSGICESIRFYRLRLEIRRRARHRQGRARHLRRNNRSLSLAMLAILALAVDPARCQRCERPRHLRLHNRFVMAWPIDWWANKGPAGCVSPCPHSSLSPMTWACAERRHALGIIPPHAIRMAGHATSHTNSTRDG